MISIGLDLHSRTSTLALYEPTGRCREVRTVKGRPHKMVEVLAKLNESFQLVFEATTGYGRWYDAINLMPHAQRVVVAHPGKLAAIFRSKTKNDKNDAKTLARLLQLDAVPEVWVPPVDVRQWRRLIEHRRSTVAKRTRAKNALRALLRTHGIVQPSGASGGRGLWTIAGRFWLGGVELPSVSKAIQRDQLLMEVQSCDAMVKRVEVELDRIAAECPKVALLMTIPGVGPRTAEAMVAYIDDPNRFKKSNAVGSYFGLVPIQDESAGKARFGHITKQGPGTARWLLVEAAWRGIQHSPRLRAFFERVCRGRKDRRKIALVATAHHLVKIMLQMLKHNEAWREIEAQATVKAAA